MFSCDDVCLSVHSWLHLCIDLDLQSGLVNLDVNRKVVGERIEVKELKTFAGNITLDHVVLGENNEGGRLHWTFN